jgi:ParB family chromosome partitioning protein
MDKKAELLHAMGSNMEESVGVRTEESAQLPQDNPGVLQAGRGRYAGFARLEGAGVLEIERLAPDSEQPRKTFDEAELEILAASIRQRGLLQPLRVRYNPELDKYVITVGARRYFACLRAGARQVPVVVVEDEPHREDLLWERLAENANREDLLPVEAARAYQQYMEWTGCSGKELAERLWISPSKVSRALALLKLDAPVQAQVEAGTLSATAGAEISKLKDPVKQRQVAERAVATSMPAEEVAKQVRQKRGKAAAPNPGHPRPVFKVGRGVAVIIRAKRVLTGQEVAAALAEAANQVVEFEYYNPAL